MVDNAQGQIKHTCYCRGHYCWNVGIIRRRKIPRDQLTAVYFTPETELEECIGCGSCAEICPAEVISIRRRTADSAPESFYDLHQPIRQEKSL